MSSVNILNKALHQDKRTTIFIYPYISTSMRYQYISNSLFRGHFDEDGLGSHFAPLIAFASHSG